MIPSSSPQGAADSLYTEAAHPGGYFFFTRDPLELRPALEARPADERPADERGADLARPAEEEIRAPLERLVEVVLTVRPELDLTRPDDAELRAGE
jgi:hypothetical protein